MNIDGISLCVHRLFVSPAHHCCHVARVLSRTPAMARCLPISRDDEHCRSQYGSVRTSDSKCSPSLNYLHAASVFLKPHGVRPHFCAVQQNWVDGRHEELPSLQSRAARVRHYLTKLTDTDLCLFCGFPEVFSERQFRVDRYPKVHSGGFRFDDLITDPYRHNRFYSSPRQYRDLSHQDFRF